MDVKLYNYSNLNLLCNFDNGAIAMIDEDNIDNVTEMLNTSNEDARMALEDIGFFDLSGDNKQAYLHVTHRCNMDCSGCYSAISNRNKQQDLDLEDIKDILDRLKENGFVDLVISGGEPMLRADIGQIVDYAKSLSMNIIMITNGSIDIDPSIIEKLYMLSISIDDLSKGNNELGRKINKESILKQAEKARNLGILYSGIITITSQNIDKIDYFFEMSNKYNLPITFSLFHSNDPKDKKYILDDNQLAKLAISNYDYLKYLVEGIEGIDDMSCRKSCGAGSITISVDASGNLAPCHFLHNINLGNLLENPDLAFNNLNDFSKMISNKKTQCNSCDHQFLCGEGCLARSFASGGFEERDPYCNLYKTYYNLLKDELVSMTH